VAGVTVRYFAGARAAAGVAEEHAEAGTLGELVDDLGARHGDRLATVLKASAYLLDGRSVRDLDLALPDGSTLDVLPPFAGG